MHFATLSPANTLSAYLLETAVSSFKSPKDDPLAWRHLQRAWKGTEYQSARYVFSFENDCLPNDPQEGWIVGRGMDITEHDSSRVDFLISKPVVNDDDKAEFRLIGPSHLKFHIHKESGALVFTPTSENHSVEVLMGATWEEIPYGQTRAVIFPHTKLRLSEYVEYLLEYDISDDQTQEYLNCLQQFMSSYAGESSSQPVKFLPTIRTQVFKAGQICIDSNSIGKGGFGWVSKGLSFSGEAMAVKEIGAKSRYEYIAAKLEFDMAKIFRNAKYVMAAQQMWCSHDRDISQATCTACTLGVRKHTGVRLYISAKLAQSSFTGIFMQLQYRLKFKTLKTLFYQSFLGLSEIHARGILHRDVTAQNILVVSTDPPLAQITDFGKAIAHHDSELQMDTHICPVSYVPPEVWAGNGYGFSVDVFTLALGLASGLVPLPKGWFPTNRISETKLNEYKASLNQYSEATPEYSSLVSLLTSILRWEVRDRPTLREALQHDCWKDTTGLPYMETGEITGVDPTGKKLKTSHPGATSASGKGNLSKKAEPTAEGVGKQPQPRAGDSGKKAEPEMEGSGQKVESTQEFSSGFYKA